MYLYDKNIPKEHRQKIEIVINYIFKNLDDDLSMTSLARIANYSPYYFQKLFKRLIGDSPKQYINKMRLEAAAYHLAIDMHKSINEISIDCGFSSPAVFSRAFKNYFGVSAETMRSMSPSERKTIIKNPYAYEKLIKRTKATGKSELTLKIEIKKLPSLSGICINTIYEDPNQVQQSLKDVVKLAASHDLISPDSKIIGIIYPNHNTYRAFVSINPSKSIPRELDKIEIKSGKYAAFKLNSCSQDALDSATSYFNQFWLPENGYKMSETFVLEFFSENPSVKSYTEIEREIFIPIVPL